jgi:hypothetical protein
MKDNQWKSIQAPLVMALKKDEGHLLPQYAKVLKFTNMDLRNILLQLVTTEPVPRVVQPILSMEEDKKNLLCLV